MYWESHGDGPPLLRIMGLSFNLDMWFRVLPPLAERYRLILLDNRGVGGSDCPRGPYRISMMAEDALAVLDAAGVHEPAAILGASMGGMIAQEIALRRPERVHSLILGCTACGPIHRAAWPNFRRAPGLWQWLYLRGEARERSLIPFLYADDTPPERVAEDIAIRLRRPSSLRGTIYQLAAIFGWNSSQRLRQLRVPVLILHGDTDHVLPVANAHAIARNVPHAKLVVLKGAGHMLITDQLEASLDAVLSFLAETANPGLSGRTSTSSRTSL